jgi:acyl-coenzyme A thioesterase PaaI-like protein
MSEPAITDTATTEYVDTIPPWGSDGHGSAIGELGMRYDFDGDQLVGVGEINEFMLVPGTSVVRTSVLATWADFVSGTLSSATFNPRICVTLDLDLHLHRQPIGTGDVEIRGSIVRAGRSLVVVAVKFVMQGDELPFGFGHAGFMASPNPAHVVPEGQQLGSLSRRASLTIPWADRAGIVRSGPARAEVERTLEIVNPTSAIQGGVVAMLAEESILSGRPGEVLSSLALRYLSGLRGRSAAAEAEVHGDLALATLTDHPSGRVATLATARLQPAAA